MKITTLEVAGLEQALKGMRNPMNSWHNSDTICCYDLQSVGCEECVYQNINCDCQFVDCSIGKADMDLAQRLIKGGAEHRKYRRMIQVWADFDMPRYWWSEFDTYKIGTTANSCSTMHKLLNNPNPIELEQFVYCSEDIILMKVIVDKLEKLRKLYREKPDDRLLVRAKRILPEGFLQLRTVNLNYETIANMYHQRKHHRLKEEWIDVFCTWVESLPYAKELIIYQG